MGSGRSPEQHKVVITGGGTAGISVAARPLRRGGAAGIAVVEPSESHYYRPLWTLAGGGLLKDLA